MFYAALAFFVMALASMALGFMGVIRGSAGIVNVTLLASLILFAIGTVTNYRRRQLHHG